MFKVFSCNLLLGLVSISHCQSYFARRSADSKSLKENEKLIHFVRHAEGHHNVAGRLNPLFGYLREDLVDAELTDYGESQCKALSVKSIPNLNGVELLVVSPMRRTLQTATLSFPQHLQSFPWVALENIREQTGKHPCDHRSTISALKQQFSHVNFDHVSAEEDPLYFLYPNRREPSDMVSARAKSVLDWLAERKEKEIVVVSHQGWLSHLFNELLETDDQQDKAKFQNCEVRSFIVDFSKVGLQSDKDSL